MKLHVFSRYFFFELVNTLLLRSAMLRIAVTADGIDFNASRDFSY